MGNSFSICQRDFPELYAKPETLMTLELEQELLKLQESKERTTFIEAKINHQQVEFTKNSNNSEIHQQLELKDETDTLKKGTVGKEQSFEDSSQKEDVNTQK